MTTNRPTIATAAIAGTATGLALIALAWAICRHITDTINQLINGHHQP